MARSPKFIRRPRIRLSHVRLKAPPKPTAMMLFYVTLLFIVFVFGGGVYMFVNAGQPWLIPLGQGPNGEPILVYPGDIGRQLIIEGLVIMIFIIIGFFGSILIFDSNKHSFSRGYSQKLLLMGIVFLAVSFLGFWWIFQIKT